MNETKVKNEALPPPPGIIGSIRKGFDTIANHILAILPPLVLDLVLWLGPHLSIDRLVQPLLNTYVPMAASSNLTSGNASDVMNYYQQALQDFNLLNILRTFPIGVFSLMNGERPTHSPLGQILTWQVDSVGLLIGLIFLLTVFGWVLGGLYFYWIAALVNPAPANPAASVVFHSLVYSLFWTVLSWIIGLPVLSIVYLLLQINPLIAEGAILVLGFMAMWILVPVFFSPHGMFVRKQNAFLSILSSFQISRFTLPTSSLFVLTILLIGIGLNFLWVVPPDNSWLTLVGILGHAFVTTALLASSFVYYQDMSLWLQKVLQQLRSGIPSQPV